MRRTRRDILKLFGVTAATGVAAKQGAQAVKEVPVPTPKAVDDGTRLDEFGDLVLQDRYEEIGRQIEQRARAEQEEAMRRVWEQAKRLEEEYKDFTRQAMVANEDMTKYRGAVESSIDRSAKRALRMKDAVQQGRAELTRELKESEPM